jgi:hypothetical protein
LDSNVRVCGGSPDVPTEKTKKIERKFELTVLENGSTLTMQGLA